MRYLAVIFVVLGCRAEVHIPDGVFACSTTPDCPPDFVCGDDGLCYSTADAGEDVGDVGDVGDVSRDVADAPDSGDAQIEDGGDADSSDTDAGDTDAGDAAIEDTGRIEDGGDASDASDVDAGCASDEDCPATMREEATCDIAQGGVCVTAPCSEFERNCDLRGGCETRGDSCICFLDLNSCGAARYCAASSMTCVECLANEHCRTAGASRCEFGTCIPCQDADDCTHLGRNLMCIQEHCEPV